MPNSSIIAQIPNELEEASRVSGGSRVRALFGVLFRLLLPSALNGWLLCFVVVSGSLAVPLLLSPRGQSLLAVKIYEFYTTADIVSSATIFVLFVIEILIVTGIVQMLKRLVAKPTGRARALTAADAGDPDWTGAIPAQSARHPRARRSVRTADGRVDDTGLPSTHPSIQRSNT
ncbi:ABC transporter permease subunit [Homoserinimonas sp. A520]